MFLKKLQKGKSQTKRYKFVGTRRPDHEIQAFREFLNGKWGGEQILPPLNNIRQVLKLFSSTCPSYLQQTPEKHRAHSKASRGENQNYMPTPVQYNRESERGGTYEVATITLQSTENLRGNTKKDSIGSFQSMEKNFFKHKRFRFISIFNVFLNNFQPFYSIM